MKESNQQGMKEKIRDIFGNVKSWVIDHIRIVMPVVLAVCVLITLLIALSLRSSKIAKDQAVEEAATAATTVVEEEPALELNAYPELNALMESYYTAMANGDTDAITALNTNLDETEKIRIREIGKYIESYPTIDVYSKPGPEEGTYICYVYTKVKFKDYSNEIPGMQTMYVCTKEDGSLYINEGEETEEVTDFIKETSLQDDVVDLNNKVTAEYNDMLAADEDLTFFLNDLSSSIDVSVGEQLAAAKGDAVLEGATEEAATEATSDENSAVKKITAKENVNVRATDSETSEAVGQAVAGDSFVLVVAKDNGWSKIEYDGQDAYVKSEFFTYADGSEVAVAEASDEGSSSEQASTDTATETTSTGNGQDLVNPSKATALTTVVVRKTEGESAEQLGTVYQGTALDVIMKMGDGWTKVTYEGQTGYVKSEFFSFSE